MRSSGATGTSKPCYHCGKSNHKATACYYKEAVCNNCKKKGHIAKICRSKLPTKSAHTSGKQPAKPTHFVDHDIDEQEQPSEYNPWPMFTVNICNNTNELNNFFTVTMTINGHTVGMQIDTGAAVSVMSVVTYEQLWKPTNTKLTTYSGDVLKTVGILTCNFEYQNQQCQLPLVIVDTPGPTLLGQNWLSQIQLDWPAISKQVLLLQDKTLSPVLNQFQKVFRNELGTFTGPKVKLAVDPQVPPKFYKARSLPYAMRDKVEQELKNLQAAAIIEPISFSEWAAPVLPVLKHDKQSIHLCGDYRLTVNQAVQLDQFPIPKIEDLLAKLSGGKYFSSLDMSQAYQQLPLDDESKKLVVINTHKGLFAYNHLPFGVSSAPGIFQQTVENLLQDIPNVLIYLDDILVASEIPEEHCRTLAEVLSRLLKAGLRLKKDKYTFMTTSVQYLGYQIDAHGIHPTEAKVRAIKEARTPKNVSELKAYLGILITVNFYLTFQYCWHPFIPCFKRTKLGHGLMHKNRHFSNQKRY